MAWGRINKLLSLQITMTTSLCIWKNYPSTPINFFSLPDARIFALTEIPAPTTKKELQSFCGMVSSLKAWFPNVSFSNKNLAQRGYNTGHFVWLSLIVGLLIYNLAFQSLFLIWNGLLFIIWLSIFALWDFYIYHKLYIENRNWVWEIQVLTTQ